MFIKIEPLITCILVNKSVKSRNLILLKSTTNYYAHLYLSDENESKV